MRNRLLAYAALALAGFYVMSDPTGAADSAKSVLGTAREFADALIEFGKAVTS